MQFAPSFQASVRRSPQVTAKPSSIAAQWMRMFAAAQQSAQRAAFERSDAAVYRPPSDAELDQRVRMSGEW
jgi:hypothetical protein